MGREQLIGPVTDYIAREFRAQKGRLELTNDKIAELSGVSKTTVQRAMQGKSAIAVEALVALCAALRLDVAKLVDEAQKEGRSN